MTMIDLPEPYEALDYPVIPMTSVERIIEENCERRWRFIRVGKFAHAEVEVVHGSQDPV